MKQLLLIDDHGRDPWELVALLRGNGYAVSLSGDENTLECRPTGTLEETAKPRFMEPVKSETGGHEGFTAPAPHHGNAAENADLHACDEAALIVGADDGVILDCNEGFARLTGYERRDILGHPLPGLTFFLDPEPWSAAHRNLEETGSVEGLETRIQRRDGLVIYVRMSILRVEFDRLPRHVITVRSRPADKSTVAAEPRKTLPGSGLEIDLLRDVDITSEEIGRLIDFQSIQDLMNSFYKVTHIGIGINDIRGNVQVATGWQDICTRFHRLHPETLKNCLESDIHLSQDTDGNGIALYKCKNNMWDAAVPLHIGGRHIANIFLGQFFFADEIPDYEFFRQQAELYGFDTDAYLVALDRVPRWSRETVENVMEFYAKLASLISRLSIGNIQLAQALAEQRRIEDKLKLTVFSIDNISDAVQWITLDTRFWNVNRATCDMLGYTREEMLSLSVGDIDPYFTLKEWQAYLEEIKRTGSIKLSRFHRTKDGRIFPVEITCTYLKFNDIEYYCAIVRDNTERARAEKEASFFRALIEYTRDPVYVLDPGDGCRLVYVNQAACAHFGRSREELLAMRIPDWDPQFDVAEVGLNVPKMKEGKSIRFETVHKVASGRLVPVEVTANYLEHDGRELAAGYFHDISARRRMQDEQLRSQKLESLGVLAGGIAHDFNNLLTGVMGNLSLIRMLLPENGKALERIDRCEKVVKQASGLTCQLLTFARGGEPVKKTINLSGLVRDAVSFVLRGSNVAAKLEIDEDLWNIEADEGQIGQVINNILINADQSMPRGGVVRVDVENIHLGTDEVSALEPGPYVRIAVTDQGCGITAENLNKIFDPYFTTKETGTGLGLTSLYSIVKKHMGEVLVTSRVGEGTRFEVYLPASPGCGRKEVDLPPVSPVTVDEGYVVIMDDEESIRDVAAEMLSSVGYRVKTCSDGEEVMELYRSCMYLGDVPDVLIMDLTIPGEMGGLEAAAKILGIDPSARLIVSSGYSNDPILASYSKHGFREALLKPFSLEELRVAIRSALR